MSLDSPPHSALPDTRQPNTDPELPPLLSELIRLTPKVVARIAPRRWREELVQEVLCTCWLAMRNGSEIRSSFDYVRCAARRALGRLQRRCGEARLTFDSPLVDRIPAPSPRTCSLDYGTSRLRLKAALDERHRAIYESLFERGLGVRATARACGCDPQQVRRGLAYLAALPCPLRCWAK